MVGIANSLGLLGIRRISDQIGAQADLVRFMLINAQVGTGSDSRLGDFFDRRKSVCYLN
jgi:hypothetical protein